MSCKQIEKGSDRMKQHKTSKLLRRFGEAFSEQTVTALGRSSGFLKRQRNMTPMKMVMSLLSCFAGGQGTTLADVQRSYNALSAASMAYKPFHNQLSKAAFSRFMQAMASHVLSTLVVEVLKPSRAGLLGEFGRVLLQDGSSFAVKDALRQSYPGRFTPVSPAAVELHVTWDLCRESITQVVLTPDTFSERAELPPAESLRGDLLLGDRGYFDCAYLQAVAAHGGHFLVRAQKGINPVVEAVNGGARASRIVGRTFQDVLQRLSKDRPNDLTVRWKVGRESLCCRIVSCWNAKSRQFVHLATNLPASRYDATAVSQVYRLRWQIELLFKEWKSHANLRAFSTVKPAIVEGLIWAAIVVAAVKRYLAHSAQIIAEVATSTLRAARCAWQVIPMLVEAVLASSPRRLRTAFMHAVDYLAVNAQRAHPQRDRCTGRLATGLKPVFRTA
jgi:hypothetical protein